MAILYSTPEDQCKTDTVKSFNSDPRLNTVKLLICWCQDHSTYNVLFTVPLLSSVVFWSEDSEAFLHHPPGPAKAEGTNADCKVNSQETEGVVN